MGYSLIIGEHIVEQAEDYTHQTAQVVSLPTAPAFGEPTDYTNQRWPSYTGWREFSEFCELLPLMFDRSDSLIAEHPGYTVLTKEHKEEIDEAYKRFYDLYPNAVATFKSDKLVDHYACRLEWLKFWVDWALENCKNPVFMNY